MFRNIIKQAAPGTLDYLDHGRVGTLTQVLNDTEYSKVDMFATLTDRGNGVFKTVLTTSVQPNGYTIIQSIVAPTISFSLVYSGRVNVRNVGITGLGLVNDSPAFQFLVSNSIPVEGNPNDRYLLQDRVTGYDVAFDFDMKGGEFLEDTAAGQSFQIRNPLLNQVSVTAFNTVVLNSIALTTLTLTNSTAYNVGDVVKVFSDDLIRPEVVNIRQEYRAEYAVVTAKSLSTITLNTSLKLITALSTNIRVCKLKPLKFRFVDTKFGLVTERATYGFPYHISCEGYIAPQFHKLEVTGAAGIFVRTLSCYGAMGKGISGSNLANDTANGKYGYGVADYGSQASNWYDLSFGKCRHAYTTGSDDIDINASPSAMSYGGAVRCHVWSGTCTGATSFAWDTHMDAVECVFHDIVAGAETRISDLDTAGSGGFSDRGLGTVVHKFTYHGRSSAGATPDRPIAYGTGCSNPRIHEVHLHGDNLKIGNFWGVVPCSFFFGSVNVYSKALLNDFLDFNTSGTVRIQKLNYHISGDISSVEAGMSLVAIRGSGAFYLDECNLFADAGGEQIVTNPDYTLVKVASSELNKGVFAKFNIYCGAAGEFYLGNSTVLDAGSNPIAKGNIEVNVFAGVTSPRTKEIVLNLGAGSNVTFSEKVYANLSGVENKQDSSVGSANLTAATSTLHFGPEGYPWNRSENRYAHQRLVKHVTSTSATNQITDIVKPAFNGQEFILYVPASSESFVIIGDCPGMHTDWSASNVTFTAGASYAFIARWDSVTSEYLWDYLP